MPSSTNPFLASSERIDHYNEYDNYSSPAPPRYSEEFPTSSQHNQYYGDSKNPPMPTIPQQHSAPRQVTGSTTVAVLTSTTGTPLQRSGSITSISSSSDVSPISQSDVSMDVSTYYGSTTQLHRNDSSIVSWVRRGRNQTVEDLKKYRNSNIPDNELERRKKEVEERVRAEIERDVKARQEMMGKEMEEYEAEMRRHKASKFLGAGRLLSLNHGDSRKDGKKMGRFPIKPALNTGVVKPNKLSKHAYKNSNVESIRKNQKNPYINEISSPMTENSPLSPLPAVSYSNRPPIPPVVSTNPFSSAIEEYEKKQTCGNHYENFYAMEAQKRSHQPLPVPQREDKYAATFRQTGELRLSAPNSAHLSDFSESPQEESPSPITGDNFFNYPAHLDPFATPSAPSAASFRQDVTGKSTDNSIQEKKPAMYLQKPVPQSSASSIYSTQTSGRPLGKKTSYDNIAREEHYARRHSGSGPATNAPKFATMQSPRFPIAAPSHARVVSTSSGSLEMREARRYSDSSVHAFAAPVSNGIYISKAQVDIPSRFSVEKERREKEESSARRKRWRNRCLCLCGLRWKYWCIALGVILLCGLGGGLAAFFVTKNHNDTAAAAVVAEEKRLKIEDLMASPGNGQPALPTILAVMKPSGAPIVNDTCVSPPQLWSCSLPPELRNTPLSNGIELGGIGFDIKLLNSTEKSVLTNPNPSALPSLQDYASLAPVDGVFNKTNPAGEETQFIASLTFPKVIKDDGFFSGVTKRQVSSPAQNPSELFPTTLKNQPLRLMDRGLDTEHYAFHTYYRKSIYIPDPASLLAKVPKGKNGNDTEEVDYAELLGAVIPKGGLAGEDAGYVCMYDVTRLSVKIFTASPPSLNNEASVVRPDGEKVPLDFTLNKFLEQQNTFLAAQNDKEKKGKVDRPDFPLPVTVEIDRIGQGESGRTSNCFKVIDGRVVLGEGRLGVAETVGNLKPKKGEQAGRGCGCGWRNWA